MARRRSAVHAWFWLLIVPAAPLLFWAWAALHEFSHVAVAALVAPIKRWSVNLIPHREEDGWRFASSNWTWTRIPSLPKLALVYLAPRVPNALALVALPLGPKLPPGWPRVAWAVLFGSALVDLVVGSIGSTRSSDLQRAATAGGWSPWIPRVLGFVALGASVGAWLELTLRR